MRIQQLSKQQPEAGFTLLEILVAVMVFGLLTTSVFYFLGQQNSMSSRAADSEKSLNLAKLVLDSLKVSPYDSLRSGSDTVAERYLRSWYVSVKRDNAGNALGNVQVDVTIAWPLTGTSNLSMSTLVSNERFKEATGGPMKSEAKTSGGFTTVELIIGFTVGAIVLAGVYRLWRTNSYEGMRLQQKIELRNQMALSTKKLNQSIIEAGYGLDKVVGLAKDDAVGTDTLTLYRNPSQQRTTLAWNYHGSQHYLMVANGSIFQNAKYIVLAKGDTGEVRAIARVEGSTILLTSGFNYNYTVAGTSVLPCTQDKYYTNQETQNLVRTVNGVPSIIGRKIHNFQVSFRDRNGVQTENLEDVRFVNYSLTGVYTAQEGALSSVVFSSTSIPRNLL